MTVSEKTIEVIVVPRASKTEIVDYPGAALKIRLQAPPVDGAANEELIRFLAEHFKKNKNTNNHNTWPQLTQETSPDQLNIELITPASC